MDRQIIIASNRKLRCRCLNCRNEDRLITFNLDRETAAVILIHRHATTGTTYAIHRSHHRPLSRIPVINRNDILIHVSTIIVEYIVVTTRKRNNRKLVFRRKEKKARINTRFKPNLSTLARVNSCKDALTFDRCSSLVICEAAIIGTGAHADSS